MSQKEIESQISALITKLAFVPEDERPSFIKDHIPKYSVILGGSEKEVEAGLLKLFLLIDASRRCN